MKVGIISWGVYVPYYRIKIEEIARIWGANSKAIKKGLKIKEKSVPAIDEDSVTIAVEASRNAIKRANIDPREIGAVFIGSETHPYAVKPTATIVAAAIDAVEDLTAADYVIAAFFSCSSLHARRV